MLVSVLIGFAQTSSAADDFHPAARPGNYAEVYVSPAGNDAADGTANAPVASLTEAQELERQQLGKGRAVRVILRGGTYYLPSTLVFTSQDSGTKEQPVVWRAAPGQTPVISGAVPLKLGWMPYTNGIFQAKTPPGLVWDQLFVNGKYQPMARYPNYKPGATLLESSAKNALSPSRVARWANPAGGYIHALQGAHWGSLDYLILGKKADGSLNYEGGWQVNRDIGMAPECYVENIREELDAPGEWFHDGKNDRLLYMPSPGVNLQTAKVESAQLTQLVEFQGNKEHPIQFITLQGLTFRETVRTFMQTREPVLRSDWSIFRGGAILLNGTRNCAISDCNFDRLGGNTIFVNDYNRRLTISGCLIQDVGASGIVFMGDSNAVRDAMSNHEMDATPGPKADDYPADCLVTNCLIARTGGIEKQSAPVDIDMSRNITVSHCSIYDVPRAGINIGDGCWGGNIIEFCDVFDTVLETGDHGSFNSWGRDRYWRWRGDSSLATASLDAVEPNILRNNRWRCDHGWDIDLDDGSSNYRIYNNLLLRGGLKLREGFERVATNNIIVNNSLHLHVWFTKSDDLVARNIVMGPYQPIAMPPGKWGRQIDYNLFSTPEADRMRYAAHDCDTHSLVGNPQFVNPAVGDFRVRDTSPALKLGFVNFPMDQFGVTSPRLKALAGTPVIPKLKINAPPTTPAVVSTVQWRGATFRKLIGQEFSVYGVPQGEGVLVIYAPPTSAAYVAGLRQGDFIERVNGQAIHDDKSFIEGVKRAGSAKRLELTIIRNQKALILEL